MKLSWNFIMRLISAFKINWISNSFLFFKMSISLMTPKCLNMKCAYKYSQVSFFHRKHFFYKITECFFFFFWTLWHFIPLLWVSVWGIIVQSDKHTWRDISFFHQQTQSNVNLEQHSEFGRCWTLYPCFAACIYLNECVCHYITCKFVVLLIFIGCLCASHSFSTVNISGPPYQKRCRTLPIKPSNGFAEGKNTGDMFGILRNNTAIMLLKYILNCIQLIAFRKLFFVS